MPTRLAAEIFEGFTSTPLFYSPPEPFLPCNPSIMIVGDEHPDPVKRRCIVRCINYRLGYYVPEEPETRNVMLELDANWDITKAVDMVDETGVPKSGYPISGFEDCRLFKYAGRLYASATTCHTTPQGNRELVVLEIDWDTYAFKRLIRLSGPWVAHYQKNWIPIIDRGMRFIYSVDRGIVIEHTSEFAPQYCKVGLSDVHVNDVKWEYQHGIGHHRGSSQALRVPGHTDKHIAIVHTEEYQSKFALFDSESWKVTHMTERFHFRELNVEFCAGLALDGSPVSARPMTLVASYSVKDSTAELGFFPLESVLAKMEPVHS